MSWGVGKLKEILNITLRRTIRGLGFGLRLEILNPCYLLLKLLRARLISICRDSQANWLLTVLRHKWICTELLPCRRESPTVSWLGIKLSGWYHSSTVPGNQSLFWGVGLGMINYVM